MLEQLQWLATCGRPWAEERAAIAIQMTLQLGAGAITESEYQELMQDLINSDKLNECADDQEVKNLFTQSFTDGAHAEFLDLSGLKPGVYMVNMTVNGTTVSKKLSVTE
jgi:hypothetical protein